MYEYKEDDDTELEYWNISNFSDEEIEQIRKLDTHSAYEIAHEPVETDPEQTEDGDGLWI